MAERLDVALHRRGLAPTRSRAAALVMAGRVRVDGVVVTKAGTAVEPAAQLAVQGDVRYVSRGGDKLETALRELRVDPSGRQCLDVGASTGGFTDCLLQHGAAGVIALDVGRGQLHERIRGDGRVQVVEGVNARALESAELPGEADLACVDVSFISLRLVLGPVVAALRRPFDLVCLVKPQFEAGRRHAGGGVVRDPEVQAGTLRAIAGLAPRLGAVVLGACASGHPGPAGNREFFLHLVSDDHPDAHTAPADLGAVLGAAVATPDPARHGDDPR